MRFRTPSDPRPQTSKTGVPGSSPAVPVHLAGRECVVDHSGEVEPLLLPGSELEPPLDAAHDQTELTVVDAVDEDHSGMRSASGGPLANDLGEVRDIVRNEDASVFTPEREDILVVEPLVLRLLVERADVVASVTLKRPPLSTDDPGGPGRTALVLAASHEGNAPAL